ncbi:MAG: 16S rRNA (cytosine(1402)-N(4))-methyltransferase RsmH [Acidobacteria bacterium]|nr:16S rRNA (cytosine(1402)-N(4))-methyltransferase RsmH [Acidobacteriota bacterium]
MHLPVLLAETLRYLKADNPDISVPRLFVDCTLGLGGHSERLLEVSPQHHVIAFDRDAEAIAIARERLARFGERFVPVHTDYRQIKTVLAELEAVRVEKHALPVAGILADLGVSSFQLDAPERGFSFRFNPGEQAPPLDMRMDRSRGETAAHLLNTLSERELADLIYQYGEEHAARRIARRIVTERDKAPLVTTAQLAELVVRAVHQKGHWRIHPATRTFQALRIAVNRELEGLEQFVADAIEMLASDGRLVILTFHSLEDRIIKQTFRFQAGMCRCPSNQPVCVCGAVPRVEILTRKAVPPGEQEIATNPRARSAKLRACRKL